LRGREPLGRRRLISTAIRVALITLSIILALMLVGSRNWFQFDFKGDLYGAGRAIVSGRNPYQPGVVDAYAAVLRTGGTPAILAVPLYPPPALLAAVPFSLLPFNVAGVLFMLLSMAAVIVALRLLGVRDWRCIGVACLSDPAMTGAWIGNVSPLLLLGAAVAWRWRSSVVRPAVAVASVLATKLILWPLVLWLALTRRLRAAVLTLATALVGTFAAWAVIGFAGLSSYPHLLASDAYKDEGRGFSLVSALLSVGLPVGVARALALGAAVALLLAAWMLVRRPDGDERAFGLAVMAALIASPVIWDHYLVLLFAPIALLSRRLSLMWFLPMLAGLTRVPATDPSVWHSIPDLAIEAIVIGWLSAPILRRRIAPELAPVQAGPLTALENSA
jgi:hypothetical protein